MHAYEIEVKSLLGSPEAAAALRERMREVDPDYERIGTNTQLNHYFHKGSMRDLYEEVRDLFDEDVQARLKRIVDEGHDTSVRTRKLDDTVLLVVKASIDDTTSANGVARIEFEHEVQGLSFEQLDKRVLRSGFEYQAKWSREREEYRVREMNVTIDRNAGYGYLAEFEKVVDDPARAETAQEELRLLMRELAVEELAQDRLERMFAHYNAHWPEYYGTEKIFVIE